MMKPKYTKSFQETTDTEWKFHENEDRCYIGHHTQACQNCISGGWSRNLDLEKKNGF